MMKIKRDSSFYLYSFFHVLMLLFCSFFPLMSSHASNGSAVVAKVGDHEISSGWLNRVVESYVPQGGMHITVDPERRRTYRDQALKEVIEVDLMAIEARKRGIAVVKEQVDLVMKINIERHGSKEEFEKNLVGMGITPQSFISWVEKYQLVNALNGILISESVYSEDELKDHYVKNRERFRRPEARRLYHILLTVPPNASEPQWESRKEEAESILSRIKAGEDFGLMAYQYSDDDYRYKSGDLGFVHKGRLATKELDKAAFSLNDGEVSGVVRTIYGFHILKGGEKRDEGYVSFEEAKDRMKKELEEKRFNDKRDSILEKLKKEYPVQIFESARENAGD
ncbi:MAG: peptidylprolyl isomerase [Nitrospirota bacterium]|nr:MAG: peptidylprolyl isomerase [Nitrospirota bacterium]